MDALHYGKYKNKTSSNSAYKYHRYFSKQLTKEQVQVSNAISDIIADSKKITGI